MNKLLNKIFIFLISVIILSGVYSYFSNGIKSEAAAASSDSSLSSSKTKNKSSTTPTTNASSTLDEKIAANTAFISKLVSLKKIKIDDSLFSNNLFTKLNDNYIKIERTSVGRSNPFALIQSNTSKVAAVVAPLVVTNEATKITDKNAVLNGTINEQNATNIYFEYGTTEALGKITNIAKQSMIGSFAINVSGLNPKTKYFFRAVAMVNNVLVNGNIISFNTN